jgi:hypothetical protein
MAPEIPPELQEAQKVEEEAFEERDRLRRYGDALRQEADRKKEEEAAEWRRIRIPVGILYRHPQDLQGL